MEIEINSHRSLIFRCLCLDLLASVLITVIVPVVFILSVQLIAIVFSKPRVSNHLAQCHTLLRILDEQLRYEIYALATVELPLGRVKRYCIFTGHPYRLLLRVMIEGQRRAQQRIQYATKGPQVTLIRVGLLIKNFWCNVPKCSKGLLSFLMGANHLSETEVDKFGH